ncbi:MAG: sulfatase-like hydrolase/transferase [Planctomycetota bacterium]
MSARLPNILILMPDQMRADCMGCAGHPQIRTPNIDRLASEGVRFTQATTVCPICQPARASFINGLYPHNHHMWTNAGRMPPDDETVFHHLKRAGYYTAHVGKSHYYPHTFGHMRDHEGYMHARGLDYVHETTGPWSTLTMDSYMTDRWAKFGLVEKFRHDYHERRKHKGIGVWPSPLPIEEFPDTYVGRQVVQFIDTYKEDKPLCLFVGFPGPHEPWDAPAMYFKMYDPMKTPKAIRSGSPGEWMPDHARERMMSGRQENLDREIIGMIRANYYGKISLIDHWIGEIMSAFAQRGWLEDAFIIFWSDHGEMAGDHLRLHKSVFYESSIRVPLLLRWPGRIEFGKSSDSPVEIIDVFSTILEATESKPSDRCMGESLWPLLRHPDVHYRDAAYSEIFHDGHRNFMIRTPDYKYAMDDEGRGYMLFNLDNDPTEQDNLLGHPNFRNIEQELRESLFHFLVRTQYQL